MIGSIERRLHDCCAAPAAARSGAVSFLQRFGSALNEHWHYHVCVSDGVFTDASTGRVEFVPALVDSPADSAVVQARVRRRVLAAYRRRGWLDADSAADMAQWQHGGGFSVDASVVIHGNDRAGLERVLRYCARPCWASERLTRASDGERLIYTLPKPAMDGRCHIILTPLELIDRLVRFIPAPRRHLHRYHGASDDQAPRIGRGLCVFVQASPAWIEPVRVAPAQARSWARLIARIYEVDPLRCRHCGGAMQLIAFIIESAMIVRILDHLGEPSRALRRAPIRGPPRTDDYWGDWDAIVDCDNDSSDPVRHVMPDYESQRQDLSG